MFIPQKVSILVISISLPCILFLSFPKTLMAQENAAIERSSIPKGLYDLEVAEFLYHTRNYPDAFLFSKDILKQNKNPAESERALLLKELSGLYLQYHDNAPHSLLSENSASGIFLLFDTLYRQGEYDDMLSVSKGADDAVSLYFRGLAFYMLDRFDEAADTIIKIYKKGTIFPNARILLSQIMAAKGDTGAAERYLKEALNISQGDTTNRIYLLLGYLYFEKGEFFKAQENFFKIDDRSSFYRNARFGAAWSDIRMGLYDKALSLTGNIGEHAPYYDKNELEMRLAGAYSYYRLGRLKEAKEGFLGTLKDLREAEEGFKLLAEGNSLNKKYSMRILPLSPSWSGIKGEDAGKIQADSDDGAYIGFFKDAPDVALAAAYHNGFIIIKAAYEKKDADINSLIMSLKDSIKAKEEVMADAINRMKRINDLLAGLAKKIESAAKKEPLKDDNPSSSENSIIHRWERLLNRSLTKQEKYVVHIIAMNGEEGLWCLNNTTYCPILYMMTIDPSKNHAENSEQGILERIVKDTEGVRRRELTLHEKEVGLLKGALSKRIDGEKSLIQKLEALRVVVANNKKSAEQGVDNSLKFMQGHIARRAAMMRYEIRALEQKAIEGLKEVDNKMEASKR